MIYKQTSIATCLPTPEKCVQGQTPNLHPIGMNPYIFFDKNLIVKNVVFATISKGELMSLFSRKEENRDREHVPVTNS